MAQLNFPNSPALGDVYAGDNGVDYTYTSVNGLNVWTAAFGAALTLTSPGSISGTAQIGATLTYTTGTATGGVPPYAFTWDWKKVSDNSVLQANGATYIVPASLLGDNVYVQLTVTDANSNTATGVTTTFPVPPADITYASIPSSAWNPTPSTGLNTIPGASGGPYTGAGTLITPGGCIEASVNGGAYLSTPQAITPSQSLAVRWKSTPACGDANSNTALTGSISDGTAQNSYSITVNRVPTPAIANISDSGIALLTATSKGIAAPVAGLNASAYVTLGTGSTGTSIEVSTAAGGPFVPAPASGSTSFPITNGQTLYIKQTTGNATNVGYTAIVKVGDANGVLANTVTYTATTVTAAPFPPTTWAPTPAGQMDLTNPGTNSGTWNGANGATITAAGCAEVSIDGVGYSASVTVNTSQTLYQRWKQTAGCGLATSGTTLTGSVSDGIGQNSYTVTVNRKPASFTFTPVTGATLSSVNASNSVSVTGVNTTAYVTAAAASTGTSIQGSINAGTTWTNIPASGIGFPVENSDNLLVRLTTNSTASSVNTAIINIGDGDNVPATLTTSTFSVTNTSSAAIPTTVYNPTAGQPNATPAATNIPGETLNGTVSTPWNGTEPSTTLTPASGLLIGKNGGALGTTPVSVTNSGTDTVQVAFDPTYIATVADAGAATKTFTSTYLSANYTNTFSYTVDKNPTWTAPQTVTGVTPSTQTSTGVLTPVAYNSPVTVSFAAPSVPSGATAMTAVSVVINGGAPTAVTLGTTTVSMNPGDTIQVFGTTGAVVSGKYGVAITIGSSAAQDWFVTNSATVASITTPSISSPANGTANLNPATNSPAGIPLVASAYSAQNGAGATQTSSTWEVYKGSFPLTSTSAITAVAQNAATAWTSAATMTGWGTTFISSVAYGNGKWVAAGNSGQFSTSTDGTTWTSAATMTGWSSFIDSVAYGNGKWVAVGNIGKFSTSTDGSTWTSAATMTGWGTNVVSTPAYANGKWVAAGANGLFSTSTDGTTWTSAATMTGWGTDTIISVAYGNGKWVAAGDNGQFSTSTDGTTWTSAATLTGWGTNGIYSVAYANSKWVAVGANGKFSTSTDGTTWTSAATMTGWGTNFIYSVAYANGTWVAAGDAGKFSTSTDGSTWTSAATITGWGTNAIFSVAQGNGKWVAGGNNGQFSTNTTPGGSTTLTIAGCQTDGFLAGDSVLSDPGAAASGVISTVDNTTVVVVPSSASWANGQSLKRDPASYVAVTGSPITVSVAPFTTVNIPQANLAVSSTYYARVQYATTNVTAATSSFSGWSSFGTASAFVPAAGAAFGGGYFAGQINDGGTIYNLIVAPVSAGALSGTNTSGIQYKTTRTFDPDPSTLNLVYGGTTTDVFKASAAHPVFSTFINGATGPNAGAFNLATGGAGGGTGIGGFNDWYLPARNELEILYYNLKPSATSNSASGTNPNAVPARAFPYTYTAGSPAQTTSALFAGGAQAFSTADYYWSSSVNSVSTNFSWGQDFDDGFQNNLGKDDSYYARAIRRVLA